MRNIAKCVLIKENYSNNKNKLHKDDISFTNILYQKKTKEAQSISLLKQSKASSAVDKNEL